MPRVLPVTNALRPVRSMAVVMRRKASTSAAVPRVWLRAPGMIRWSRPDSTAPGPISMNVASGASAAAACMHSIQRTGAVSCSARRRTARAPVRTGSAVALATIGKRRVGEPGGAERRLEPGDRRRHQRRVKRPAHLERQHPLGAAGLAGLAGASHRRGIARDDGLVRRVEIGGDRHPIRGGRLGARRLDTGRVEPEHGRHRAGPLRAGLVASARRAGAPGALRRGAESDPAAT